MSCFCLTYNFQPFTVYRIGNGYAQLEQRPRRPEHEYDSLWNTLFTGLFERHRPVHWHGVYWHNHTKAIVCPCLEEIREASRKLVGQCITPYRGKKDMVSLTVVTDGHPETLFLARNKLTQATALGFLHLLRHLSDETGAVLTDMNPDIDYPSYYYICPSGRRRERFEFNWSLVNSRGFVRGGSTYKFPKLHCNNLHLNTRLSTTLLKGVNRFFSRVHTIH